MNKSQGVVEYIISGQVMFILELYIIGDRKLNFH